MSQYKERAAGKNRIILGCMTFGPDEDKGARVTSLDEYKKVLNHLQKEGYNELDTARAYIGGKQESWTSQAGYKDLGFIISSKIYPGQNKEQKHTKENIEKAMDISRKDLGVEKVPIYYLHAADRSTPIHETLKAMNDMHKAGKFETFAISNYTAAEVAEICTICRYEGWVQPTLYQGMYNAITRSPEAELVPILRRYKIDWVVYNPVAGGLLSGKYNTKDAPKEGRFSDTAASGAMYRKRYFRDSTFDAIKLIDDTIKKHDLTMMEVALRWLVHHSELKMANKGGNDGIIMGVSKFEQLESNLKDVEKGPLPEDVIKALDEAWAIVKPQAANYWHLDNEYTYELTEDMYGKK